MADKTRARMLVVLMDGRAWTARELAHATGVAASTATEHLHRLVVAGLVSERRQGRHRYIQIAGPHIASALESVAALGNHPAAPVRSLRESTIKEQLERARTCYDHFAGALGIAITDALVQKGVLIEDSLELTTDGISWLDESLQTAFQPGRRAITRACLDWTERRSHVAGALGAHITTVFKEREWVRQARSSRAVVVTPAGVDALDQCFGIDFAPN